MVLFEAYTCMYL